MSDVMLFGVLRMPFDLAMGDHLAQQQFYQRAQECADRLEKAEAALAASQQARAAATDANELQLKLVAIISSATSLGEQRVYDLADSIMQTLPAAALQQESMPSRAEQTAKPKHSPLPDVPAVGNETVQ